MTLLSPWGEKLNRDLPLPEYPRMQLQRNSYTCLNGVWECQINHGEEPEQTAWQPVVVPFAVGCALSGVNHELQPGEVLWYRTYFRYELTGDRLAQRPGSRQPPRRLYTVLAGRLTIYQGAQRNAGAGHG